MSDDRFGRAAADREWRARVKVRAVRSRVRMAARNQAPLVEQKRRARTEENLGGAS